ncbi:hypothetical protein L210DRAFT_3521987 [Boletus edulis BED1]|uniref:Uncharacterized protein n=1 Tax=Boletus edulis BED1 TaxID=1328754 RepID=A0AAD4C7D4_BOLED|nr:hypothetical protein L210DRAFT_3521987 [Boletus edulis BED1]
MSALTSGRAREIQRMTEFEEDNFTRLIMKKKEAQRRRRDEEDLALVPVVGDAVVAGWKTNLKMCCVLWRGRRRAP